MGMDKKVRRKALHFVLLDGLGKAFVTSEYDEARLERVLGAAS
jgi:3-dehydroquinate synthetase